MTQGAQHWEAVYQQKQVDEVSWFQPKPTYSLDFISDSGIQPQQAMIDVGGGASTLVDALLDAGYQDVSVLDIAYTALQHAQTRLGERATQVTWLQSDITAFVPPKTYALWHDRAVFHFLLEAADRRRYIEVLHQALQPGGHLVLAAFSPTGPTHCSGLPIVRYDVALLMHTLGAGFQLLSTRQEAHQTPAGKTQDFLYFHLQKQV